MLKLYRVTPAKTDSAYWYSNSWNCKRMSGNSTALFSTPLWSFDSPRRKNHLCKRVSVSRLLSVLSQIQNQRRNEIKREGDVDTNTFDIRIWLTTTLDSFEMKCKKDDAQWSLEIESYFIFGRMMRHAPCHQRKSKADNLILYYNFHNKWGAFAVLAGILVSRKSC